jgi:hypothetical protein
MIRPQRVNRDNDEGKCGHARHANRRRMRITRGAFWKHGLMVTARLSERPSPKYITGSIPRARDVTRGVWIWLPCNTPIKAAMNLSEDDCLVCVSSSCSLTSISVDAESYWNAAAPDTSSRNTSPLECQQPNLVRLRERRLSLPLTTRFDESSRIERRNLTAAMRTRGAWKT